MLIRSLIQPPDSPSLLDGSKGTSSRPPFIDTFESIVLRIIATNCRHARDGTQINSDVMLIHFLIQSPVSPPSLDGLMTHGLTAISYSSTFSSSLPPSLHCSMDQMGRLHVLPTSTTCSNWWSYGLPQRIAVTHETAHVD